MSNWFGGSYGNGFCNTSGGWSLLGGGLMGLLLLIVIGVVIYFIWKNNSGRSGNGGPHQGVQMMSTSELEAELARRKTQSDLQDEVAKLKQQLADLQKEKAE
jgi:uncharacterized membrane protein